MYQVPPTATTSSFTLYPKLTLDHCFVRRHLLPKVQLRLLDSKSIGIQTDHRYAIHLSLTSSHGTPSEPAADQHLVRYHIRKLLRPDTINRIPTTVDRVIGKANSLSEDVDNLNATVTSIY